MKFLCVSCNTQMKLLKGQAAVSPDEKGSLAIQFECPRCLMVVGMLTNAFETQLVTSLGVEIGGETVSKSKEAASSKCPFSETARQLMAGSEKVKELVWTAQARVRLQNIPSFVQSYAKKGIEQFALERGYHQVNEKCLDEAKEYFDM